MKVLFCSHHFNFFNNNLITNQLLSINMDAILDTDDDGFIDNAAKSPGNKLMNLMLD